MWLKGPTDPFLELNRQTFPSSRHLWGRWLPNTHNFFFNWLTLDHRWYTRFLRKSWKIKRIAEKYRQDLQQLSCRDLLYKGQATEELSVNIHFIHSSNTLNGHICVWCFLCSSIWKIKIFTPRRLQQAQMSSRQLWAFGGIQQTNINWIGTEQKHQNIKKLQGRIQLCSQLNTEQGSWCCSNLVRPQM